MCFFQTWQKKGTHFWKKLPVIHSSCPKQKRVRSAAGCKAGLWGARRGAARRCRRRHVPRLASPAPRPCPRPPRCWADGLACHRPHDGVSLISHARNARCTCPTCRLHAAARLPRRLAVAARRVDAGPRPAGVAGRRTPVTPPLLLRGPPLLGCPEMPLHVVAAGGTGAPQRPPPPSLPDAPAAR